MRTKATVGQCGLWIWCVLALVMGGLVWPACAGQEPGPFDAKRWNVSPFYAHKVTEWGAQTGRSAAGLSVGYAPVDNIEVAVSALSYGYTDRPVIESIDEAAVDFKGYLPLGTSGLAPYGLIGYTRDHARDENLMNAGAGVAFRWKVLNVFAQGKYRQNFRERGNQFLFEAGGGLTW